MGLDQIQALESPQATIELKPATPNATKREATVRLRPTATAGATLELAARVDGRAGLLHFPGVFQVVPARPRITAVRTAAPVDLSIPLREGEIPAGSFVSFTLKVESSSQSTLTLKCDGATNSVPQTFTAPDPTTLFFSIDPGSIGNTGCKLTAVMESELLGISDPFTLGTLVRVPRIEKFSVTNDAAPGGYIGVLEGWDLETIERTGWNATLGLPTAELPRPIAGQGAKQTLRIAIPWPSPAPKSPLFVFLRGESQGRPTRITQ